MRHQRRCRTRQSRHVDAPRRRPLDGDEAVSRECSTEFFTIARRNLKNGTASSSPSSPGASADQSSGAKSSSSVCESKCSSGRFVTGGVSSTESGVRSMATMMVVLCYPLLCYPVLCYRLLCYPLLCSVTRRVESGRAATLLLSLAMHAVVCSQVTCN